MILDALIIGNSCQMDLSGPGIDVKLKERKERKDNSLGTAKKIQIFFPCYVS
jgi:hypothetical protein